MVYLSNYDSNFALWIIKRLPKNKVDIAVMESMPFNLIYEIFDKYRYFRTTPMKSLIEVLETKQVKNTNNWCLNYILSGFWWFLNCMIFGCTGRGVSLGVPLLALTIIWDGTISVAKSVATKYCLCLATQVFTEIILPAPSAITIVPSVKPIHQNCCLGKYENSFLKEF